ncbi:hypothetical protein HW555_005724, partial [Spodoptera exigua]
SKAAGEFSVLYTPDSLHFSSTDKTSESHLKEIFSAALGLSVEQNSEWKGLVVVNPFDTPEAVVELYIDGINSLCENISLKTYKLTVDEYEPDTYKAVKERIKQHFTEGGNKIANVKLSDGYEFSTLFGNFLIGKPTKETFAYLRHTVEEDYLFINELEILRAVIKWIKDGGIVPDNQIDFFSFRIRTLHGVSDYHGPNSLQTKEAKKLLGGAIQELSEAFVTAYDGSVLVTVVSTNVAHTRRQPRSVSTQDLNYTDRKWPFDWLDTSSNLKKNRYKFKKSDGTADYEWMSRAILDPNNATEPSTPSNSSDTTNNTNTATDEFEVDYPAIFNIFLWFGIIMTFSLLAIMYSMMDMDPGRDSIIYRMTNTRMKKDN